MKKLIPFCFAILLLSHYTNAQSEGFIENKGQWNNKVKFCTNQGGNNFFLEPGGYKVALNNPDDLKEIANYFSHHKGTGTQKDIQDVSGKKLVLHSHAYEVKFLGADLNAKLIPEDASGTFNNYFSGNDPSKWATGCKIFYSVIYKNIYPGIDVKYYSNPLAELFFKNLGQKMKCSCLS